MKKIAISTLILGITLYGGMFEHSTDVKSKYWFDSDNQSENAKLAAELAKFQNGTATDEEIAKYIKAINDDNQTRDFADGIYVDAAILQERESKIERPVTYEDKESCGWFFGLFGCDEEETVTDNNTSIQSDEDIKEANDAADKAVEQLDNELSDSNNTEETLEEQGALQESIDSDEPAVVEEVGPETETEVQEQTQNEENPAEGAEQ